jgi:type II secretory pathway pseudopilin PulG
MAPARLSLLIGLEPPQSINMTKSSDIVRQTGATLVEVLVAIALVGIMLPALSAAIISSSDSRPEATAQLNAASLLQQITEATRSVREAGWSNIASDGTYHPVVSGSSWTLSSGSGTSGNFTDQVVISDVERDSGGNIVSSGGTVDPSTKLVVATVSWTRPISSSISSDMYLTRWQSESSWTQTTVADFSGDTLSNTVVTNVSGGEVQLSPGQSSGTLTSSTFDAGGNAGFNYLGFTSVVPAGTTLQFQVAANNDNATWNYVGPDGSSSSYFSSPGAIPLSLASDRYFRYQATLSGSAGSTPVIDDVSLGYSP